MCYEQETVHWRVHKREALREALASLTQRRLLAAFLAWRHRTTVLLARHVVCVADPFNTHQYPYHVSTNEVFGLY